MDRPPPSLAPVDVRARLDVLRVSEGWFAKQLGRSRWAVRSWMAGHFTSAYIATRAVGILDAEAERQRQVLARYPRRRKRRART